MTSFWAKLPTCDSLFFFFTNHRFVEECTLPSHGLVKFSLHKLYSQYSPCKVPFNTYNWRLPYSIIIKLRIEKFIGRQKYLSTDLSGQLRKQPWQQKLDKASQPWQQKLDKASQSDKNLKRWKLKKLQK